MFPTNKTIDPESHIPYYIQLIKVLKEKISRGDWKPGDKIPSETELCSTYSVSRTVVRQALREIELDGLILRRKGKGTFIAEPKINETLVQRLTGFYQDMVDQGRKPVTKVLQFEVQPASPKVAAYLELEPEAPVFCLERLRFVDDQPVVLVTTFLSYVLCPTLADYDLSQRSLYSVLEGEFGLKISHGRRTIEAVAAKKSEAQLLMVEEGDPLLLLDSVTCLEDGTPVEYYHALRPGNRSRFEVSLVRMPTPKSLIDQIEAKTFDLPGSS
jgi:GntR family transcriptional regulator